MVNDFAIFLLVLLSLAIGFCFGRWRLGPSFFLRLFCGQPGPLKKLPYDAQKAQYIQSLTHFFNDRSDEAADAFISSMDVTPDTLALHLSVGSLLRRKGELGAALKVHQNLLNKTTLSQSERHNVQLQIADDFWHSGLLDRAEVMLKELVDSANISNANRNRALMRLLDVYRDMHEWLQAIDVADQLTAAKFAETPDHWRITQAQFCCELAEACNNDVQAQWKWLRDALRFDPHCARAFLLQAELQMQEKKNLEAISSLKCVAHHKPEFISEVFTPLARYYGELAQTEKTNEQYAQDLHFFFFADRSLSSAKHVFEWSTQHCGFVEAMRFLQQELPAVKERYSQGGAGANAKAVRCDAAMCVVEAWLSCNCSCDCHAVATQADDGAKLKNGTVFEGQKEKQNEADPAGVAEALTLAAPSSGLAISFEQTLNVLLDDPQRYACQQCSFVGEKLHWLCPGCKGWASIHRV